MGVTTIRPSSDFGNGGGITNIGGGSLSDDSDASYRILAPPTWVEVNMGDIGAPAGNQRILQVRPRARLDRFNGSFTIDTHLYQTDGSGNYQDCYYVGGSGGGIFNITGSYQTSSPSGTEWSLAQVNALRVQFRDYGGGTTGPEVYELYADVDIRTQPNVLSTGPSGTNPGATRTPTITWAFQDPDGIQGQLGYHVKLFTSPQSNPDVGGAYYDSGDVVSGSTSHTVSSLADGTYYVYVKVSKDFRGGHWFSTWGSTVAGSTSTITINDTPSTPTTIVPTSGSTITTSKPTVGATVVASPLSTPGYLEWQLATDNAFTLNTRSITEAVGDATVSGAHTEAWGTTTRIAQGVWWIRARTRDGTGKIGPWSSGISFTVSHPPAPANLTPTGDVTLIYGASGTVNFQWSFTDPDIAGDTQTAYQVVIERNDTNALVNDSGQVSSTSTTFSFNIPVGQKDQPLRWKVRLWDSDGVVGAYSSNQLFRVSDAPQVAITYPTAGGLVNNARPNFTWTVSLTGGRTVASARVRVQAVGAAVGSTADSGVLTGPVLAWQPANNILVNGTNYTVQVDIVDSTAIAGTATQSFSVLFAQPRPVPFTLDATPYDASGYVGLAWDNSVQDGQFTRYRVYRRLPGTTTWTFVKEVGTIAAAYTVQDQLAAAGTTYEWTVTQLGVRYGVEIESPRPGENRTPSLGFEVAASGWTLDGSGGSATRLTTDGSGTSTSSIELIDTSTTLNSRLIQTNVDDTPVAAGETLTFDVDLKILDAVTTPYLTFTYSDGSVQSFQITGLASNIWTNVKRSFVVPAGKIAGAAMITPGDPVNATGPNLLTLNQASIETDATGWGTTTNCTISRTTAQFLDGVASLQLSSSAAGTMGAKNNPLLSIPVTPGKTYTAKISTRAAVSVRNFSVGINWRDAGGTLLSSSTSTSIPNITTGWTEATMTGVAPVGAVYGSIEVQILSTGGAAEVHYADRASVVEVVSVGQVRVDNLQIYSAAQTATPVTTNYWLIDPDNYLNSLALWNVTTETFSTEYDEAFIPIIGRGRKHDIGTRLGVTGTCTVQVRDKSGVSARTQRQDIEYLRDLRKTLYLRNPFGDVYQISPGAIQIDRLAGVGLNEYSTITIPYQEVAA